MKELMDKFELEIPEMIKTRELNLDLIEMIVRKIRLWLERRNPNSFSGIAP